MPTSKHDPHPYHGTPGGWGSLKASGIKTVHEGGMKQTVAALLKVNQKKGFDCPGCAWPEPDDRSPFEFCEQGVKAVSSESTSRRVTHEFFQQHSVSDLLTQSDFWLEDQGRLTAPMKYDAETDHYLPCSWEDAFTQIGQSLQDLDHPDQALFYTSGRTSNEAAFLYQLFGRMYGTNNFPDCSNMCHESSGTALTESIGIGKGSVTLEDFSHADLILVIGQNPTSNHPRMMAQLQKAHRRGARIVSINPLLEMGLERFIHPQEPVPMMTGRSTAISDIYLQPTIGGDMAVFMGLIKAVLEREDQAPGTILDREFIDQHTSGLDDLMPMIHKTSWEDLERQSGLPEAAIREVANLYCESKAVIACWAMGLTQNKHAVATIQQVVNLLLLRGNIGRTGAGVCPVRGHSNVQGDRTVGITEHPSPAFLDALKAQFKFDPPRKSGLDTVGAIKAMAEDQAHVFIAMGGNFARATPDPVYTEAALKKCRLTVHITTKLNRSHLIHGDQALILPCLGRTEKDVQAKGPQRVTVENSMGVVHGSLGQNTPASSELLSEPAIVGGMAKATLKDIPLDWDSLVGDYRYIRDHIEACVPGFSGYNQAVENGMALVLYNSAREREWKTETGKARFMGYALPDQTLAEGLFRFATIRSHDQYNTTIYSQDDRYRGIKNNRRVVFMNLRDMETLGFKTGTLIDLESHSEDGIIRTVKGFELLPYPIARGCAAGYYPETNGLISVDSIADRSRTPLSKFIPVRIIASNQNQ